MGIASGGVFAIGQLSVIGVGICRRCLIRTLIGQSQCQVIVLGLEVHFHFSKRSFACCLFKYFNLIKENPGAACSDGKTKVCRGYVRVIQGSKDIAFSGALCSSTSTVQRNPFVTAVFHFNFDITGHSDSAIAAKGA